MHLDSDQLSAKQTITHHLLNIVTSKLILDESQPSMSCSKNLKPSERPIWVQMILYYRYGNIYREVINTKLIDWCVIMDGVTGHLFLMQTIRQIKSFVRKNIHKCPYGEDIELKNITLDDGKGFDVFPEGIYKSSWITRNKTMDIIWRFNASIHVRSPIKESMG